VVEVGALLRVVHELAQRERHEQHAGDDPHSAVAHAPATVGAGAEDPRGEQRQDPPSCSRRKRSTSAASSSPSGTEPPPAGCPPSTMPRSSASSRVDTTFELAHVGAHLVVVADRVVDPAPARGRRADRDRGGRARARPAARSARAARAWPAVGGRRHVVRDGCPQRCRAQAARPARVVQDADDPGGSLVLRTLELEPVDQLGIGGGAGDAHATGVGHVAEQRAERDDHLAAGLLGHRHDRAAERPPTRTLGSTPRSTTRSRSLRT